MKWLSWLRKDAHSEVPARSPAEQKGFSWVRAEDDTVSFGRDNLIYPSLKNRDATKNTVAMSCFHWALRNIHQARPEVVAISRDGQEVTNANHPAAELIRKPQALIKQDQRSILTGRLLHEALVYGRIFVGNTYILKVKNASGLVIGLDLLPWGSVNPVGVRGQSGVISHYDVLTSKGMVKHAPEDIIHDRVGIDERNMLIGVSPLVSAMRLILTDNEIAVYLQGVMKSPNPRLMISPKDAMSTPDATEADFLAEKFTQKSSRDRAGGAIVPTFPVDVTPFSFSPDQMAIDIVNKLPEERITALLGIPAIVAGIGAGLDRSTYSNMKEAREAATEEFLLPNWEMMGELFTDNLMPHYDPSGMLSIRYNTSNVRSLQEDSDKKHERVRADFRDNIINLAEAREALGKTPNQGDEKIWSWMLKPSGAPPPNTAGIKKAMERAKSERLI